MTDFFGLGWRDLVLVLAGLVGVYLAFSVLKLFQTSRKPMATVTQDDWMPPSRTEADRSATEAGAYAAVEASVLAERGLAVDDLPDPYSRSVGGRERKASGGEAVSAATTPAARRPGEPEVVLLFEPLAKPKPRFAWLRNLLSRKPSQDEFAGESAVEAANAGQASAGLEGNSQAGAGNADSDFSFAEPRLPESVRGSLAAAAYAAASAPLSDALPPASSPIGSGTGQSTWPTAPAVAPTWPQAGRTPRTNDEWADTERIGGTGGRAVDEPPARASLESEVQRLQQEGESLREELQRLAEEVQRLKSERVVSPFYAEAVALAQRGLTVEEIADQCGISMGEAELVSALAKSNVATDQNR